MAIKQKSMGHPRVFAYIIRTVGAGYWLKGSVPLESHGKVFFGACKKRMRPDVEPGDYILGISGSGAGHPRRVLLWMRVAERLTFRQAYERGKTDKTFRGIRGKAIHVRPRRFAVHFAGEPECYEHINGAPHSDDWRTDIRGSRDVFLVGGRHSWVADSDKAPQVTEELVELLKEGINWKGHATIRNPLTENARGKHAVMTGRAAQEVISRVQRVPKPFNSSRRRSAYACVRTCSCE